VNVKLAGRPVDPSVLSAVERHAERCFAPALAREFDRHAAVLGLRDCESQTAYLARHIEVLRTRLAVSTGDFRVRRRRGLCGAIAAGVKWALWRLSRHQHDHVAFEQNIVNSQLACEIELFTALYRKELTDLRARVTALEERARGSAHEQPL